MNRCIQLVEYIYFNGVYINLIIGYITEVKRKKLMNVTSFFERYQL